MGGAERLHGRAIGPQITSRGAWRIKVTYRLVLFRVGLDERQHPNELAYEDSRRSQGMENLVPDRPAHLSAFVVGIALRAPQFEPVGQWPEIALERRKHVVRSPVVIRNLLDDNILGVLNFIAETAVKLLPATGRPVARRCRRNEERALIVPEKHLWRFIIFAWTPLPVDQSQPAPKRPLDRRPFG